MPTSFKINKPMNDEILEHIRAHPKVIAADTVFQNGQQITTVTLDQNYTPTQIRNTAVQYIIAKYDEIRDRGPNVKEEYEI